MMRLTTIIQIILAAFILCGGSAYAQSDTVYVIPVADAISPGVADYIKKGIEKASETGAAAVVIELDTPGGLADSMRKIVMAIYKSEIPVVVFVSPSGARAASAGVMITMAADIAAMAPGTNIGAAHPVGAGGKEINETMEDKVTNDMVAYVKGIAKKRDRNEEWAEKAVRESVSVTASEALENNIIDLIAEDMDDLIKQINGREIAGKGTLNLQDPQMVVMKETFRDKVLKTISNPNIAYILMLIGLAGLYFELSHPGAIFPGVIGGIAIILAFFALQTLPVNYAGLLLIVLAVVFFIMEMKIASYGLLSVAGVTSLLLGSLMLFEGDSPEIRVAWQVMIPTVGLISAFFIAVAGMVFKAHVSQPRTGVSGLIGQVGVVKNIIDPAGKVFIRGELWNAEAGTTIPEGVKVRVVNVTNLMLEVEAVEEASEATTA
ncbi:Putative membrane-bound ClpP-class protease associated with aq_911 [Olavius algarvensis associated proteobacterium Delta 3]|nr:Putative membrane-bound ClpP-class protease associated with aq_911 [Olavius algarvensis associated proteobacterium Delta 3]